MNNKSIKITQQSELRISFLSVYKLAALFLTFSVFSFQAQDVSFSETIKDSDPGIDGLDGSYGVAVSPDDKYIYTASSTDDAVNAFKRNAADGSLVLVSTYKDDSQVGGTIAGLDGAKRLTVSPDGNHVFVPSSTDDALVVFSRNSASGTLKHLHTYTDGVGGVDGLNGAYEVIVSPDNNHVYVIGSSDDAVAVFSRNTATGLLTFVEVLFDGVGGIDGLNSPRGITSSMNGKFIYIASAIDDAIAVFSRNTATGALTFVEIVKDGVGGVDGLNGAYGIFVSPDDKHIYAVGSSDDAVAVFERNAITGTLTYFEVHKDDSQGGAISSLNAARNVSGSSDGLYVFAVSSSDDALIVFDRNPVNGALSLNEEFIDNEAGVDGVDGARSLAITSDNNFLYTIASSDDAISIFTFSVLLPVEMAFFNAQAFENEVQLGWETASETKQVHFTIQKSQHGDKWIDLIQLEGKGSLNKRNDYQAADSNPFSGTSYYRLKQIDFNGETSYSLAKVVHIAIQTVNIFPNPTSGELHIEGTSSDFQLYTSLGQAINLNELNVNHYEEKHSLNLSQLKAGTYILKTESGSKMIQKL